MEKAETGDFQERCFFRDATDAEAEAQSPGQLQRYEFAAEHLMPGPVLDVACGSGYGTALLAKKAGVLAMGLDVDPQAVAWARGHFGDRARFDLTGEGDWPVGEASFPNVVSIETIEHVPPEMAPNFMANVFRALRPQGRLVMTTPLNETDRRRSPENPFHKREYSWTEFRSLVEPRFEIVGHYSQAVPLATAYQRTAEIPGGGLLRSFVRRLPAGLRARDLLMKRKAFASLSIVSEKVEGAVAQIIVARKKST
jgi:cyclopropane fatty-acyl-phospholipid synthase-like methyltransferase